MDISNMQRTEVLHLPQGKPITENITGIEQAKYVPL